MRQIRLASHRGAADHGWLDTRHTFSFASYHDPRHMGFRSLRVINEDRVAPGAGFGAHPHRDMEILSYVLEGQLEHRDSLGHGATLGPDELQRITAGTGLRHSEFNPDPQRPVHFYQIWLLPERSGLEPSWEQKRLDIAPNRWNLAASPDGVEGSLTIRQDARLWIGRLGAGQILNYSLTPGRHAWVQVTRGQVTVDGTALRAGDGLAISDESGLQVQSAEGGEVLLFDLA
jgi:redox-sensitive bicupin YhaK (pirin superfamily)